MVRTFLKEIDFSQTHHFILTAKKETAPTSRDGLLYLRITEIVID